MDYDSGKSVGSTYLVHAVCYWLQNLTDKNWLFDFGQHHFDNPCPIDVVLPDCPCCAIQVS
jgi:hypothetical protein